MRDCTYLFEGRCSRSCLACKANCPDMLARSDEQFLKKWTDPLTVISRSRVPASDVLRDMLAGGAAFLIGGGPSANELPLEWLNRKGVWSLAVNNVAGHARFRPQAFVCSDPPSKFSHSIWLDPGVMKFVPTPKLGGRRSRLRAKIDGRFVGWPEFTVNSAACPNTWGFVRNPWMWPDDRFFETNGACWGNHDKGVGKTGERKTVCTMLLGLRLLRFLGARRVYLVGVDFDMAPDRGYSFGQGRTQGACDSNNAQFAVVNEWLCRMQDGGVFARFGLEVFNCNPVSGLRAFSHVPFDRAIIDAKGLVEDVPDLAAWYDK